MEVAENLHSGATVVEDVDICDAIEEESTTTDICQRLHEMISADLCNFDSWTAIIDEVERTCKDNMDKICLAYDSLLSKFPLCHWYWKRYAYEIVRLSDPNKAVEIFERALSLGMYSLGLWLDYCLFGMSFFEDKDVVRRLFKTAILFVGKDYYCHALWDQYIKFEYSQQNWSSLANIYLEVLRHPTGKLHEYYDNFKNFVVGMEEEITHEKNYEIELEGVLSNDVTLLCKSEISRVIEDLQSPDDEAVRSKAICKYKFIGNQFYEKARELDEKIKCFEENIQRQYFDITPLDDGQLRNWHCYLDFMEKKQGDFSWALEVFERCLISCANYPEFWIRYVEFMESKGGRELATFALERATKIFLKDMPEIHLFSFRFKEQIGDTKAARAAVILLDMGSDFYLTRHVIELANMERRSGNVEAAYDIYDKAIKIAEEKKHWHSLSSLFIHLSRLKYMITGAVDGSRDVLINGIQRVPHCRALLEELIKFVMTHQGPSQVNLLDSIIARAISPSTDGSQVLDPKDQEDISSLFLEFVDLCGTVDDIRKARNRHIQLFPQYLRSNFVCKTPNSNNLSNENLEQKQDPSAFLPSQFEEHKSKIKHIEEDQIHLLPVNNDCNADLVSACLSAEKYDTEQNLSNQVAVESTVAATDMKEADPNLVNQFVGPTPKLAGSTQSLAEQRQDKPDTQEIAPTSGLNSSADKSSPNALSCDLKYKSRATAPVGLSHKQSSSTSMQEREFEHHLEPVYSENHSSKSLQKVSEKITPGASGEQKASLETTKIYRNVPKGGLNADTVSHAASPNHGPSADSYQVQEHLEEVSSDTLLSPTNHQKHTPIEMTTCTDGEYHKRKHREIIPEGGSSEVLSHSEDQKLSPQDLTIACSEVLVTQRHPLPSAANMRGTGQVHQEACSVQQNMFSNHFRPINPGSEQNQQCTSPPLVSSLQPNSTPTSVQSSHQATSPHPNQAMNQIWQLSHHQHQHLLQQQYQQQQLQMMQQQHQQSYQHQQQHDPQQHQDSPGPYQVNQQQPPHSQQVQQQQQLYYQQQQFMQQLYQQAEKLTYQMHQQGYALETAQAYAYQMLWQQYQLHQQGYAQMSHKEQDNQQLHVYNQMMPQQQQNDQHKHFQESRIPEPDLLKGQIQNLPAKENLKEGSNSNREMTPEPAYRRPQH